MPENRNSRENLNSDETCGSTEPNNREKKQNLFTLSSNIIFTNCCKVNSTLYFGQLPPLELPPDRADTGGARYAGGIAYGKMMAPMWLVTSYRLATN